MTLTRRRTLVGLGALLALPACTFQVGQREGAAERAIRALTGHQGPDGAFRSLHYGILGVGDTLTALAAFALGPYPGSGPALAAALDHLERRVLAGAVPLGVDGARAEYPVYATALALSAFRASRPGSPAVGLLRAWLAGAQLVAGWEGTPAYGGFPMGGVLRPVPPYPGHVDLSMTRRALRALGPEPAVIEPARAFLAACRRGDGAIYSPVAEPLNKGARGPDGRSGPYGTPTADWVLASLAIGVPPSDPSLAAPLAWLHAHFTSQENPGVSGGPVAEYAPAMTMLWLASLAEVLAVAPAPVGDAANRVAGAALALQGPDGLWKNTSGLQKEDDPVVATCLGLVAIGKGA